MSFLKALFTKPPAQVEQTVEKPGKLLAIEDVEMPDESDLDRMAEAFVEQKNELARRFKRSTDPLCAAIRERRKGR